MTNLALLASRPAERPRRRLDPVALLACAFLVFLLLCALAPGLVSGRDPLAIAPAEAFSPPSPAHWFGTDESGRDIFSRLVWGARDSLLIGVSATAIGVGLGLVLGVLAALAGKIADVVTSRAIEVLLAFPGLMLALFLIALYGPGVGTAILSVGLSTAPGYARIIRTRLRTVASSGYAETARILGHHPLRVLLRTILPNAIAPILGIATLGIGQAIVWAAALSYLGLGVKPPAPEWGAMLAAARTYITSAWWMTLFPGLFIVLTVLATTLAPRLLARWGARA